MLLRAPRAPLEAGSRLGPHAQLKWGRLSEEIVGWCRVGDVHAARVRSGRALAARLRPGAAGRPPGGRARRRCAAALVRILAAETASRDRSRARSGLADAARGSGSWPRPRGEPDELLDSIAGREASELPSRWRAARRARTRFRAPSASGRPASVRVAPGRIRGNFIARPRPGSRRAALVLPASADPPGPPVLSRGAALVHARVRADASGLASLVSEGSDADRMFRLRSEPSPARSSTAPGSSRCTCRGRVA
jgi:hypothetical protein